MDLNNKSLNFIRRLLLHILILINVKENLKTSIFIKEIVLFNLLGQYVEQTF